MNQTTYHEQKKERMTLRKGRNIFALIALAASMVVALIIQVHREIRSWMSPTSSSQHVSVHSIDDIVERVRRHTSLPTETPILEQIDDIALARSLNPSFYQDLQQGDWVLRYPHVVIVYRAIEDRVIRVRDTAPPSIE